MTTVFTGPSSATRDANPSISAGGTLSSSNFPAWTVFQIYGVNIGSNVAAVANSTFYSATNLTNVTIADSVTNIGTNTFANSALSTVYMTSTNGLGLTDGPGNTLSGKTGITMVLYRQCSNNKNR